MALCIDTEAVVVNAFFAGREHPFMEASMLRKFCGILHDRLERHGYAGFKADRPGMERFFDGDDRFVSGIGGAICIRRISAEDVRRVNSGYPPEVQEAISEARDAFASQCLQEVVLLP